MIKEGIYKLKEEFLPQLNIPINQWVRRKEDLLEWWEDFFDYEIIETRPLTIKIKEVYEPDEDYIQLPRKQKWTKQMKMDDYTAILLLLMKDKCGNENNYVPVSKMFCSRESMKMFCIKKYGHTSPRNVAQVYIKPIFDTYMEYEGAGAEEDKKRVWCWNTNCTPLNKEELEIWFNILKEELKIDDEERAAALYDKIYYDEDLSVEKEKYKNALFKMKEESEERGYPVHMNCWRINEEGLEKAKETDPLAVELIRQFSIQCIEDKALLMKIDGKDVVVKYKDQGKVNYNKNKSIIIYNKIK